MSELLRTQGLCSGYGRKQVLRDVTLEVHRGEIVALLGANGAGKTTLLSTITGVIPASAGKVEFEGESITGWTTPRIVRNGLAHVPQGRQLFGSMTVEENLIMGAYSRSDKDGGAGIRADMEEQYLLFPVLKERRTQLARSLSGGEQQMLAIARALMSRSRLFLLDEPSLGLAPLLVKHIMEQICRIRERGGTILLVEQNAQAALEIADRGYVLETGRITVSGTAEQLLHDSRIQDAYLGGEVSGSRGLDEHIKRVAERYKRARAETRG